MKKNLFFSLSFAICTLSIFLPTEAIRRRQKKKKEQAAHNFKLQSSAFANNGMIPKMYTCDSDDEVSPPLRWEGAPEGTKSFVILVDDPDARGGHWTHWLVFDLPAKLAYLPVNADIAYHKGVEGVNGWGSKGWGGPCPPLRKHRYKFHIYALRVPSLKLTSNASRKDVLRAMHGKVLGEGMLTGTYIRPYKR